MKRDQLTDDGIAVTLSAVASPQAASGSRRGALVVGVGRAQFIPNQLPMIKADCVIKKPRTRGTGV